MKDQYAEFVRVCQRAAIEAPPCFACRRSMPGGAVGRIPPHRRGFEFEMIATARGLPCGVVLCRNCAFIYAVGLGSSRAMVPAPDVVRDLVNGPLGQHLANVQRAIRLGGPSPRTVVVHLGGQAA